MNAPTVLRGLAALCLLCVLPRLGAAVYQFTFTQGGYEFGAYVEGTLYLRDENNDGIVTSGYGIISPDAIGGFMALKGHPLYAFLAVPLYGGSFNTADLTFTLYGDGFIDATGRLIDGFISNSRGEFSHLREYGPIYSTEPVVLRRVPDSGHTCALIAGALLAVIILGRYHGTTSVSM